jgi:serine/threonine protein kinase
MIDDVWIPAKEAKIRAQKYTVICKCGNKMKVRYKHFGRMCRCTQCRFPIYVTYENVNPPVSVTDIYLPKVYKEHEVPIKWEQGDLLMELYEVKDELGKGGMGVVYLVHHRGWGRDLAVKCPSEKLVKDETWLHQFEHECETWINMSPHPNVVECFYMRRLGGLPRLFVEYVKGRDLGYMIEHKLIYAGGQEQAIQHMLDVAIQFCWGLHHAHQLGIVHQDVKPNNVLIDEHWNASVTDFGLAKVWVSDDPSKKSSGSRGSGIGSDLDGTTVRGFSGGTPTYRSLDHKRYAEITHHTDIWSWGVSMIELFAGDIYWTDGHDAINVLENLLHYGSRYDIIPKMPKQFEELLRSCFNDDRDKRPDDMLKVADAVIEIYGNAVGEPYKRKHPELQYTDNDILNNRAVSLLDLKKNEEAESIWAEIIEDDPEHFEAMYNLALNQWRTGHITDAQIVEKLYEVCTRYPLSWLPPFFLSRILVERGDSELAVEILSGITQDPNNKRDISFGLAMAQNQVDRDRKLVWEYVPEGIRLSALTLSFDGYRAIIGGLKGELEIWDMSTHQRTHVLEKHTDRIYSVCLSEQERVVLTAAADGKACTWDAVKGECLHELKGHSGVVYSAVLSANGKYALTGSADKVVGLWHAKKGKAVRQFHGHEKSVNTVAMSRDGQFAYSGSSDCTIRQWDVWKGDCVRRFDCEGQRVTSICLNYPGTTLLAACGTHIMFWDVDSGELLQKLQAHQKEIFTVALDELGRYALTATGMGTIKIWDIITGQCLRSLKGHAPVALSRDGHFAISAGARGEFKLWATHIDESPFLAQPMICR